MATYRQISDWVRDKYGFVPTTCWIAHAKEAQGIPVRRAPNRLGKGRHRENRCPEEWKLDAIGDALDHFDMIP